MFERLLTLFLHAKTGVIAGVFLLGTTGALVTASVENSNNTTTITLTEASPSPSESASPEISKSKEPRHAGTETAEPSETPEPTESPEPSSSPLPSDCAPKLAAEADAIKAVNTAYEMYHRDLALIGRGVKTDADKKTLQDAQKLLASIRQSALKAIRATSPCAKGEEDQQGQNGEKDGDQNNVDNKQQGQNESDDEDKVTTPAVATPTPSPTPALVTLTGSDPKTLADQAVAAMKLAFDTAKAQLPVSTAKAKPSHSPRPAESPNGKGDHQGHD